MKRRLFVQALAAIPAVAQAPPGQAGGRGGAGAVEEPKLEINVAEFAADPVPRFFTPPQLGALRRVGDVLRREVLENGRTLFESDPEKVLAWEASAMSRYAHYREEVRGILDDFRRTGIGYGV